MLNQFKQDLQYILYYSMNSTCIIPWSEIPNILEKVGSFWAALEIRCGNKRTPRTFIQFDSMQNDRIYAITGFSSVDNQGQYKLGSNSISNVNCGDVSMLVLSDHRLNSPYFKNIMQNNLVAYTNRKQKTLF